MSVSRPHLLPVLAYITVSIAWGTTYAGIKVALESFPPLQLATIRFIFAGGVLMAVLRAFGLPFPALRDWLRIAPVGFLLLCCANVLVSWSQTHVDSVFAALMVNSAPIMFVAFSAMAGEKTSRLAWFGLIMGFMGLFVIVWPDFRATFAGEAVTNARDTWFWWAIGALVLSPLCWSGGSYIAKLRQPGCHPLMASAAQSFIGGIFAAIVALATGNTELRPITTNAVLGLGYLIVVGSWLGYVSYMYVVTNLPPAIASTTTYLNTIVALLVGVFLMGEGVNRWMLIGGGIVLVSVAVVNLARLGKRLESPKAPPVEERLTTVVSKH